MILITTSRRPTRRVRTFIKELERMIPDSRRIQRGKLSLQGLRDYMILHGFDRLIIVDTWKGNPGRIQFFTLEEGRLKRRVTMYLKSLSMQIDVKKPYTVSKLFVEKDEKVTKDEEVDRIYNFLKDFFHYEYQLEEREGRESKLLISKHNGQTWIGFVDHRTNRVLRPAFTIRKVIFRSEGIEIYN